MSDSLDGEHDSFLGDQKRAVECPKDKTASLVETTLHNGPNGLRCSTCEGCWLPRDSYEQWRRQQSSELRTALEPKVMDVAFDRPPSDVLAAFCPVCSHYMSRAKVGRQHSFYVERCSNCEGIWCDRGEWEALRQMGLHASIDVIFTAEWKLRIKELESFERERQATIDKLGDDIASRIFELAELLERHPNGDFGVAYLMRRFDRPSESS